MTRRPCCGVILGPGDSWDHDCAAERAKADRARRRAELDLKTIAFLEWMSRWSNRAAELLAEWRGR